MKIKVVLVSKDDEYKDRLQRRILTAYSNRIQVSAFSDLGKAQERAVELYADIFLLDESEEHNELLLPKRCTLVILTGENNVQSIGGIYAIAKYQPISELVSAVTDIYVRQAELHGIRFGDKESKQKQIVSFFSGAGGVGGSTLAAAFAVHLAERGDSVLYLNLEDIGFSDLYFSGNEKNSFDKVLYAIQMDSSSTPMKLENALNRDQNGVYFYSAASSALDMQDMNEDMLELLFEYLAKIELFRWIVVDMNFAISNRVFQQIERSTMTVFVTDGSQTANKKLQRISNALADTLQSATLRKLFLMYNRFSSKTSEKVQGTVFVEVGGVGRIENAKISEIVQIISRNDSLDELSKLNEEESV